MSKIISRLALAAVAVLLLGSCAEINERLDKLESRIGGIENETIKSIDGQINAINSSIADLGSIRSSIQSLTQTAGSQDGDIESLQKADKALGGRIDELKSYVNGELVNYAKTEWVNATFSTLAQYEETCDTIAKIDARIGALDTRLSGEIAAIVDSLNWINAQFGSYYTAAQMDAKIEALQADIDSTDAENKAKADSIAAELTAAKAAVDSAKANIRAEYRAAIDTAITALDGKLSKALQDSIAAVNGRLDHLAGWVKAIDDAVVALTGRVIALEHMIQSVSIIPAYSDGSVEAKDDTLYVDCIVKPITAAKYLKKWNFAILVNKVKTKAVSLDTIVITDNKDFSIDTLSGIVSMKKNIKDLIPFEDSSLSIAIQVINGISNITSDFASVLVPVDSVVIFKDSKVKDSLVIKVGRDSTLTTKVYPEKATYKTVSWKSTDNAVATVDYNGKVKAVAAGKARIIVTTTQGSKADTCVVTVLPEDALPGAFTVNADGKKVHFSKGNLVASVDASGNATAWKFAAHQYDYVGNASGNASGNATIGTAAGDVDLFGWSTSNNGGNSTTDNYGIKTSQDNNDYSGDFYDWGKEIDDGKTWRTLTTAEWQYLFSYDGSGDDGQNYDNGTRRDKYKYGVTVCGITNCVVLLPDNWTWNASTVGADWQIGGYPETATVDNPVTWQKMEDAGAVCLPATGCRIDFTVYEIGCYGYWSSSIYFSDVYAYCVFTDSSEVLRPDVPIYRHFGNSVRLITEE